MSRLPHVIKVVIEWAQMHAQGKRSSSNYSKGNRISGKWPDTSEQTISQ